MTSPNTAPPHLPWSEALRAVKDVTVDSFDAVLRKSAMALVIFQAPWCAQCKQMAPDVAQVAAAFRSAVIVARVDAEGNDELLDRFDVASYPRILWFDGSNEWPFFASEVRKPEVYHGAKTFKAMATFLEARSGVRAGAREQPAEPPPPPEPPPPSAPPGPPPPLALPPHACSSSRWCTPRACATSATTRTSATPTAARTSSACRRAGACRIGTATATRSSPGSMAADLRRASGTDSSVQI